MKRIIWAFIAVIALLISCDKKDIKEEVLRADIYVTGIPEAWTSPGLWAWGYNDGDPLKQRLWPFPEAALPAEDIVETYGQKYFHYILDNDFINKDIGILFTDIYGDINDNFYKKWQTRDIPHICIANGDKLYFFIAKTGEDYNLYRMP